MKNDHIKLYLMSAITMGAIFVAIAGAAFSAPAGDPPTSNITPTFSGINVNGDIDLQGTITNDKVEQQCIHTSSGEYCWDVDYNFIIDDNLEVTGDVESSGDINTSGTITSDDGIGSYYSNIKVVRITDAHTGAFEVCDEGDIMVGCEAYFDADSSSDVFKGSYIGDILGNPGAEETCWGVGEDNAGSDDYMYVTTYCFDSQGNKSGRDVDNPYF